MPQKKGPSSPSLNQLTPWDLDIFGSVMLFCFFHFSLSGNLICWSKMPPLWQHYVTYREKLMIWPKSVSHTHPASGFKGGCKKFVVSLQQLWLVWGPGRYNWFTRGFLLWWEKGRNILSKMNLASLCHSIIFRLKSAHEVLDMVTVSVCRTWGIAFFRGFFCHLKAVTNCIQSNWLHWSRLLLLSYSSKKRKRFFGFSIIYSQHFYTFFVF